jgi:hypothetical protein
MWKEVVLGIAQPQLKTGKRPIPKLGA